MIRDRVLGFLGDDRGAARRSEHLGLRSGLRYRMDRRNSWVGGRDFAHVDNAYASHSRTNSIRLV